MRLDPDRTLSEPAVEALAGLLETQPAEGFAVSDGTLLGLLRDDLGAEERERVAGLLLRSAASRRRLVALHREMATLSETPVSRWSEPARAALFLEPARERLAAVRNLVPAEWDDVVGSNERRFAAARATLERIAHHARLALAAPRMAALRGGRGGAAPDLFAEVAEDGALLATARPQGPGWEGRSAVLELADPLGGRFPIAAATLRNGRWAFRADGFGSVTGLPEGPLPNPLFRVSTEAEEPGGREPGGREPGALWAEDGTGGLLVLELAHPPHVSAGTLSLTIHVSEALREDYGDKRLVVSIPLGRHEAILGSWPVSRMRGLARLDARVFDLPEGDLPFGSILRARLDDAKEA